MNLNTKNTKEQQKVLQCFAHKTDFSLVFCSIVVTMNPGRLMGVYSTQGG